MNLIYLVQAQFYIQNKQHEDSGFLFAANAGVHPGNIICVHCLQYIYKLSLFAHNSID